MAKLRQGILGGIIGKIGNIIGTSWKGIAVIKTAPLSVANPKTAAQVAQRTKFSNVVAFSKQILATVIKPLWDRFASRESGYNAFVSQNIALFTNVSPAADSGLVMSRGKMAATSFVIAPIAEGDVALTVSFDNDAGEGFKLSDDIPFLIKFKPGNELAEGVRSQSTREDGEASFNDVSSYEEGDVVVVQLAFMRADGTIVSNSSEQHITVTA